MNITIKYKLRGDLFLTLDLGSCFLCLLATLKSILFLFFLPASHMHVWKAK